MQDDDQLNFTTLPDIRAMPRTMLICYMTTNACVTLLSLVTNSFLIHALRKLKKLHSISFQFICCLSISDVLTSSTQLTTSVVSLFIKDSNTFNLLKLSEQALVYLFSIFSNTMVVTITFDRYIRMKYPMRYDSIMRKRRVVPLVMLCVFLSTAFSVAFTLSSLYHSLLICLAVWTTTGYTLLFTLLLTYVRTYREIKAQLDAIRLRNDVTITNNRDMSQQYAKGMITVLLTLIVCYLPISVLSNYHQFYVSRDRNSNKGLPTAVSWGYIMIWLNGSLNAIIFLTFNKKMWRFTVRYLGFELNNDSTSERRDRA